jgi:tripartite motif-containing protein 71
VVGRRGGLMCGLLAVVMVGCADPGMVREFARYGKGAGELREPFGIAVDARSGDVYVVDTNNWRIEKFMPDGRFLLAWGWGVANGRSRAPQTCTSRCFAGIQGPGAGQFQFPEGVAVDNDPSSSSQA